MSDRSSLPVGGVDYPQTIQEFDEWFPAQDACAAYLAELRWPTEFVCPGLRQGQVVAHDTRAAAMRGVPASTAASRADLTDSIPPVGRRQTAVRSTSSGIRSHESQVDTPLPEFVIAG